MNIKKNMIVGSSLVLTLAMTGNAQAGWLDFLNDSTDQATETIQQGDQTINNVNQAVQTPGAVINKTATAPVQPGLTNVLMQQLGVTQAQAQGGAGALFQVAKQRMAADAFSQLSQAVPGMDGMLAAVPKQSSTVQNLAGGLSTMMGGNETVNTAASLISAFKQLDLSQGMVSQFTPIVINYVKQQGGAQLANLLQLALAGGILHRVKK